MREYIIGGIIALGFIVQAIFIDFFLILIEVMLLLFLIMYAKLLLKNLVKPMFEKFIYKIKMKKGRKNRYGYKI